MKTPNKELSLFDLIDQVGAEALNMSVAEYTRKMDALCDQQGDKRASVVLDYIFKIPGREEQVKRILNLTRHE